MTQATGGRTPAASSSDASAASILLVDDRRDNLLALEAVLGDRDYELVSATSGREALGLALRHDFAAILLDVFMPGMDGYEVATHLRAVERTRHIPIVFLTANATEVEHIYRAYSVGAVDYLIKPLDPEVVRKKVEVFVDLHRQRRQIERQGRLLLEAQRREHELSLAELRIASDRRYRKLVEGIDHVIAWSADPHILQLSFISRQAEKILGYSLEQLGEPGFLFAHIHPEDRELVVSTVREAASDGRDKDCNHRMLGAGGGILWFHTAVSVTPVEGGVAEAHGVSVDVTHLKRSEQTQRLLAGASGVLAEGLDDPQAMQRLARMLVPEIADCCLIDAVSPTGDLERVGAARLPATDAGIRPRAGGPTSSPWIARVFHTGDAEIHPHVPDPAPLIDPALRDLAPVSGVLVPLSAGGRVLGVLTLASSAVRRPLDEHDLELARDLAHRAALGLENARLYREARSASRARDDILAIVSHDLRNPLAAVMSGAELLTLHAKNSSSDTARVAATILRAATSMAHLVDNLIEIERIERDRLVLARAGQSAASLLRESVELLEGVARQAGITLSIDATAVASSEVLCDREAILRVFSNLVGNAIKFSSDGRRIVVGARPQGAHVQFYVADEGPGIAPERLARMFEGAANPIDPAKPGGLGLGLVIARGIVEAHEGRIWVESQVGAGSCFRFTLPAYDSPGADSEMIRA